MTSGRDSYNAPISYDSISIKVTHHELNDISQYFCQKLRLLNLNLNQTIGFIHLNCLGKKIHIWYDAIYNSVI